ncbi:MAG: protein-glutamate methylesterase/protein-glutamine glutaminase [Desulfovibrio sp.]
MIRVLVVDDSAFMRKAISTMLDDDPAIQVVGTAANGLEGVEQAAKLLPDVVTMDIEMPKMDGLAALRQIMMANPCPVLMVSSLTEEGADATLHAMELGAADYIPKRLTRASLDIVRIEADLVAKVKNVSGRPIRHAKRRRTEKVVLPTTQSTFRDIIAVGVSTGGPPAVQKILKSFAADFSGSLLIAQHMPANFTGPFATRLNNLCDITVKEGVHGEPVLPAHAYVCPGGQHMRVNKNGENLILEISPHPEDALYKPSVDELMQSVGTVIPERTVGVILTGMGRDGTLGCASLKQNGGIILTQSDSTCVVYGMPRSVEQSGLSDKVVDIDDMATVIIESMLA